ncbi:uncharacterized protein JCM6883_001103 [Sporobolomyces salmoneus]|uniref:uncharacterized protein n=1 Tax=Sporobolomyces salmoneus TaxID=183962 RepID=UPI00317BAD77
MRFLPGLRQPAPPVRPNMNRRYSDPFSSPNPSQAAIGTSRPSKATRPTAGVAPRGRVSAPAAPNRPLASTSSTTKGRQRFSREGEPAHRGALNPLDQGEEGREERDDSGFIEFYKDQRAEEEEEEGEASDEENIFPLPMLKPGLRPRRGHSLDPYVENWTTQFDQTAQNRLKTNLQAEFQQSFAVFDQALQMSSHLVDNVLQLDQIRTSLAQFEKTNQKTSQSLSTQLVNLNPSNQASHLQQRQRTIHQLLSKLVSISSTISSNRQATRQALTTINEEISKRLEREQNAFTRECETRIRDKFLTWARGGVSGTGSGGPGGGQGKGKGRKSSVSFAAGKGKSRGGGGKKRASAGGRRAATSGEESEGSEYRAGGGGRKKRRKTG